MQSLVYKDNDFSAMQDVQITSGKKYNKKSIQILIF